MQPDLSQHCRHCRRPLPLWAKLLLASAGIWAGLGLWLVLPAKATTMIDAEIVPNGYVVYGEWTNSDLVAAGCSGNNSPYVVARLFEGINQIGSSVYPINPQLATPNTISGTGTAGSHQYSIKFDCDQGSNYVVTEEAAYTLPYYEPVAPQPQNGTMLLFGGYGANTAGSSSNFSDSGSTFTINTATAPWVTENSLAGDLILTIYQPFQSPSCTANLYAEVSPDGSSWITSQNTGTLTFALGVAQQVTFHFSQALSAGDFEHYHFRKLSGSCPNGNLYAAYTFPDDVDAWNNGTDPDVWFEIDGGSYAPPVPDNIYTYPEDPVDEAEVEVQNINATGSCPAGTSPNNGTCAYFFKFLTNISTQATSLTDVEAYEAKIYDESGLLLCTEHGQISSYTDGVYRGAQFSPLVAGCPAFGTGQLYTWTSQVRPDENSPYGRLSTTTFKVCPQGGCDQPGGNAPTCRVMPENWFWNTETNTATGLDCIKEWLYYFIVPGPTFFDPAERLLVKIRKDRPTTYVFQLIDALAAVFSTSPASCPSWLASSVTSGTFNGWSLDICDTFAAVQDFMNTEPLPTLTKGVISVVALVAFVGAGRSFLQ